MVKLKMDKVLGDMKDRLLELRGRILSANKEWIKEGLSFEYNILEAKIEGYELATLNLNNTKVEE